MAYDKDQTDFPLPAGGKSDRKSSNFLPKYFRTDTNKKFLQSTVDQFINDGVVEKLNSFVGRRYSKARLPEDTYLSDVSAERENYQFEPGVVYKDELDNVQFYADYNDYIGQIKNFSGSVNNHSLLNRQESYSWDPHIDWDKFANFREYYWLPTGPNPIAISGQSKEVVSTYTVEVVQDGNAYSYLFTPDSLTRNPTVKLYKGQTYRFEINAPGFGMALALTREFDDNDPLLGIDSQNNSILYVEGVKKYKYNTAGELVETSDDYIEEGVIEFTPGDLAPAELYYINQRDVNISGLFTLYNIEENSEINVDQEIVGKKTYTTNKGVELSNGMKVYFQGNATPEKYNSGYYYVEGVGTAISLIAENDLEVPAVFTNVEQIPFDAENRGYDRFPYEDAASYPATKDYIVINRASADRNPWSRYNRWFHRSVIEQSALVAGIEVNLDQDARAKRPIIEFEAGLKLFNHGNVAKQNVNLVDTVTKDVFSKIEGQEGYIIDGVEVTDGMRILFTADPDPFVAGKIYRVNFINFGTGSSKTRQISLVEDSDSMPNDGDCVLVLSGNKNAGDMFNYTDSKWIKSQQKTSVNQTPLFDMFDKDGNSFSDKIIYTSSTFKGNAVFSYALGTGTADSELGFALKYQNIANVGDIVFDFNYLNSSFVYQDENSVEQTKSTEIGFLKKFDVYGNNFKYVNAWQKSEGQTKQPVLRVYENKTNNFDVDVFDFSTNLDDLYVKVFVNGNKKYVNKDYTIVKTPRFAQVVFNTDLAETDVVLLKCFSSANKNNNGFYELPKNLESNPGNDNIVSFTLGEVNSHVESIVENLVNFDGVYPGTSNLRDLGKVTKYGTRFMQHSGPMNLAIYHIVKKDANVIKSINFAKNEYAKFKQQFIREAESTGFHGSVKKHVDLIMSRLTKDKSTEFPFFASDMIPFNSGNETLHVVEYDGEAYFALKTSFDLSQINNKAVLVYVNDVQIAHGKDYVFEDGFVKIIKLLSQNDEVLIVEYENTNGCFVPPTPAKLGFMPAYLPNIYVDDTYLGNTSYLMIKGHDGSVTRAYEDYRDDLILELEMRIYNNIKTIYDVEKLDFYDFIPGHARDTGITKAAIDKIILQDFSKWLDQAGSPNYSDHSFWESENPFTYNYSNMVDFEGNRLQGFWRNVYKTYFDTDKPHTHPWEMLGFNQQPAWWQTVYGPAPYTRNNTILWNDIRDGIIREPGKTPIQNKKVAKPYITKVIPVNEFGSLIDPLTAGLAKSFVLTESKQSFNFGDQSPVETAWRRSSEYSFALLKAWVLLQPAKVIGLGFDLSRIQRDIAGNLIYTPTEKRITLADLVFPSISIEQSTNTYTSGLVNYVSNYVRFNIAANYETYQTELKNVKNQLGFKLAGFADKSKLKLVLDSRSPLNKTSVFVPDENYDIFLNTSSVQDTPSLSGFIIEKLDNGRFSIKGYDKTNPTFNVRLVLRDTVTAGDYTINVGGVSESFVEWNSDKTYSIGTIVRYNSSYYRTTVTHQSSDVFDNSKFSKLAELPLKGGVSAVISKNFENDILEVPYGAEFRSVQSVVDFMLGYEKYLVDQGFVFQNVNEASGLVEDMKLVVREFLFWVSQNWQTGTVLAVSPIANECKFSRKYYSVDNIYDPFYDISVLTGTGQLMTPAFNNIYRDKDVDFAISPIGTNDGIYLIRLPLVQTEHVVLLDNTTVFNDIIYDPVAGFRQERIKVVGYRTDNWTGNLNIPGFIYDQAKATIWTSWTDYGIGDLVKHKEFYYTAFESHTSGETFDDTKWRKLDKKPVSQILPNWDYKTAQFADFYDLDTDNFDTEQQRLAQHLIGYQPREYLANIITDSVSQYKFYQGFIQEKGTKNALSKLFDSLSAADQDSVEFYEEWALRLGQYGAIDNIEEIEYRLDESKYKLEPQIFELVENVNQNRTDLIYEIPKTKVYKKPFDYDHTIVPALNSNTTFTRNAGYVRDTQVSYIVSNWDFVADINIDDLNIGENIWITNDNNTWGCYKHVKTDHVVTDIIVTVDSNGNDVVELTTENLPKDLSVGDFIGLNSSIEGVQGFVEIAEIEVDKVRVFGLDNFDGLEETDDSAINADLGIIVSKFVKRRFSNINDLNLNLSDVSKNTVDTIWVDNNGTGNWTVYENRSVFDLSREIGNREATLGFGHSFALNKSNNILVVGNPRNEEIFVYTRTSNKFDFNTINDFVANDSHDADSDYGQSVAISPDGNIVAVGAPLASNAVTRFKGSLEPGVGYTAGDIVSDRGTLWKAKVDIASWDQAGDSSTISVTDQDWERAYVIEAGEGTVSGLTNQGVVYIYERNPVTQAYSLAHVITSPDPNANAQFGYKVELVKTSYGTTKLFVSAPTDDSGKIYFFEKDTEWKWTRNEQYKGIYSDSTKYTENNIVYYNGELYQALTNVAAGSALPTDTSKWQLTADVEHTGYIPNREQELDGEVTSNISEFGRNFAVNTFGDKLVATSIVDGKRVVEVYNEISTRWNFIQQLQEFNENTQFAFSVDINDSGDKIVVSAPLADDKGIDTGNVYLYQQTADDTYVLSQTLNSPFGEHNEVFGTALSFSNNKLAIVGKNSDIVNYTTFDLIDEDNVTVFDNGSTNFLQSIADAGRVFIFQEIGDKFVFAEDVDYRRNLQSFSLDNLKLNGNQLFISIPNYAPTAENQPIDDARYIVSDNKGIIAEISAASNANSWLPIAEQVDKPDIAKIDKVFLFNIDTQDIVQELDFIDPRQGKIAGPAEQEIAYKTPYDPAVYSSSDNSELVVDAESNWTDKYVGQVWWNIDVAGWYDTYQGDSHYRTSKFNKLIPNFEVQVCEWVATKYTPAEWTDLSGTAEGYAAGVSGLPLYENTYSTRQTYDSVKKTFTTTYYYWVRNAELVPAVNNRAMSAQDIANLIADPAGVGYRHIALLSNNKFALYNCKSLIEGTNTVLHFRVKKDETLTANIHSEYQLMSQGLDISQPNKDIENKWHDSLIGYDKLSNPVPDNTLPESQKYGILNLPRQSMFVNRIEAVKQFVDRVNWVFAQNQIVDNYNLSKLHLIDSAPLQNSGNYDVAVDSETELQFVGVAKTEIARLSLTVDSGVIVGATITNPGRGYKSAPVVEIEDGYGFGAIINTTIDSLGKVVSVDIRKGGKNYTQNAIAKVRNFSVLVNADSTLGGIWAIYAWDKVSQTWTRTQNQSYDTTKYWSYADWYATGYNINTVINQTVDYSYQLFGINNQIGDIVKINNVGTGGWLLLKKVDNQTTEDYTVNYETIGRQNGTVQLSELLYSYSSETSGYDTGLYDLAFYDKEPVDELRNIINALKEDIFVGELAVEYNELFFAAVRYALHEQTNVDWAFKTSFVRAKHNVGELKQKVNFQNDNLENYQDYIEEVKPYKTKIREYISAYSYVEPTGSMITDFDLPPSYIGNKISPSLAVYKNDRIENLYSDYDSYPYKNWLDNNKFDVIRIDVADGGSGYKTTPRVVIEGDNPPTAKAYLSKGVVKTIEIETKGQKYFKAPKVTIIGEALGREAKAVAVLGNSNVRSTHMVVRFDRVSGKRYIENINVVETFAGTGAKEKFQLKWPMDVKTTSYTVTVDGIKQLSGAFTVGNDADFSLGYERYLGYIEFVDIPATGAVIEVEYKKSTAMLNAADRIFEEYSPTVGMPGIAQNNSLASLMKGVEYEGVLYDSYSFGNEQGFGAGGFGDLPWDTFINTYEDEVIILDGSTNRIVLANPLEEGVTYNVYLNNVRIDDENYDGSTVLTNTNAVMTPIVGDGVQDYIDIDTDLVQTVDGDVITVRKSTSDGSFTPVGSTYDTSLAGGALDYTTAAGVAAGEIIVDGDGFRTERNSGGPEELVPGTVVDTLDIRVYHKPTDGIGYIGVNNYWTDAETFVYDLPSQPATADSVMLILDGELLDSTLYTVDYENNTVYFDDSTSSVGQNLCIITLGVNGADLIDYKTFEYNGTNEIVTLSSFADAKTVVLVENGRILEKDVDYTVVEVQNRAAIKLLRGNPFADIGTKLQYMIYNNTIKSYSQVIIDKSFNADSTNSNYHKFTGNIPVPFSDLPLSHKILVKSGDQILSPGYSVRYTTTDERIYEVDAWQFEDITNISDIDILVFADNKQLERKLWSWDNVEGKIRLLRQDVAPAGSKLDVYFLTNADYYFVDTKITFDQTESSPDLTTIVSPGETVKIKSDITSNTFELIAEEVTANTLTVRSINKDIRNEYIANDEFIVSVNDQDSTYLTIADVEYVLSDNVTIAKEQILDVEFIQFSNHDINNFQRYTLDVITTTNISNTSNSYLKRNLLSNGIIQLQETVPGTNYVWVIKNGYMLSPNVDYIVTQNLNAVQLSERPNENDRIDIIQFANNIVTPIFGYRIFRDMLGRTHYKRLNEENSYVLAADLNYYDYRIQLEDATGIMRPDKSRNLPGIIWIDGERIEYFDVSQNFLLQVRRGTLGTGIKTVHEAGSIAYGQGTSENISYNDTIYTHTTRADGSTRIVDMDFAVNSVHEVEVFVGGRRLRKNAISVFNPALDQDSPAGDETIAAEFTVENGVINLTTLPADGVEIKVVKKQGSTWTEPGTSLADSQKTIAKFLRGATIKLPR